MCGICGKVYLASERSVSPRLMEEMAAAIAHRGPEDQGVYCSGQVGFGHRRLTIIDLESGKQPLCNEDESVWVTYNGEIYNYLELRADLLSRGHVFRTRTDTEVLVHLYEEYGEGFVSRLRGMFAFALWDEKRKLFLLYRDRVGIKPLYYSLSPESLTFASEVKSLLTDPEVPCEVNDSGVRQFLSHFYVPGRETLFKGVVKLPPGHYLSIRGGRVEIRQYWDLEFEETRSGLSLERCVDELRELLHETMRLHMISDVPVGYFLSGGIDSTALLSIGGQETDRQISSFTIGFEGAHFEDERRYARMAAQRYGTKHYEMTFGAELFRKTLDDYVWHMEEPMCEPPAVSLYQISRLARDHVTVLISGEGGDEAFAGYPNYRNLVWLERLKAAAGPFSGLAGSLMATAGRFRLLAKLRKYAPLMNIDLEEYYFSRTSSPFGFFNRSGRDVLARGLLDASGGDPHQVIRSLFRNVQGQSVLDKMLYIDIKTWLPDRLLVKADKITMAHSLELRVPLLDHKVLEFAASLPSRRKLRGFSTKHVLKETFRDVIPREILKRKKSGFPVPYEKWMRQEMYGFVRETLLETRSMSRGYFRKQAIEDLVERNRRGEDYSREIFSLLNLELWHRRFVDNAGSRNHTPRREALRAGV